MIPLGVGLVYWPALEELFQPGAAAPDVLELEPQTAWELVHDAGGWRYRSNESLLERVAALPQRKLLHGVGNPLGGTVADRFDPVPQLRHAVRRLDPVWISEHLSFNRVRRGMQVEHAGFLLPPAQTPASVHVAAGCIDAMRRTLGRPVAFETGVNYLRPRRDELDDGAFFAAVADGADSGILLDLHNLWCNQRNGRQSVAEALSQLPLQRVWELHLAGGMAHGNAWLDAHCGAVPDEVLDIASALLPRLPNLGAIVFEILPEHLASIGLDGVQRQIEQLHRLWRQRPAPVRELRARRQALDRPLRPDAAQRAEAAAWEMALVDAIGGAALPGGPTLALEPSRDPGCALYRELIVDLRKANLARALHYTMTALLATLGADGTQALLDAYLGGQPPEPFAALEADAFAGFLRSRADRLPAVPGFADVLAFEHALVRATTHGESCELELSTDPVQLFEALDAGVMPKHPCAALNRLRIDAAAMVQHALPAMP